MRVPKNRIQTGKYTSGGEFLYKKTDTPYQGHYYILNNFYYAGKEFKDDAPELIKIVNANKLSFSSATSIFSVISGITSQKLRSPKIPSIPVGKVRTEDIRYFSKQVNVQPTTIKEISKETYESLQTNELYQTTIVGPNQSLDEANKKMPGLKDFLKG
jgi:hypothetical protein